MTLSIKNDLGTISISNALFARMIYNGMELPECAGKMWPATRRGRQLGSVPKLNDTELSMNVEVHYNEEQKICLEFSVIMLFGAGIRKTTAVLADHIADHIKKYSGRKPAEITINIAGVKSVKSKHIAKRNTKVVYRYEAD